jgi:hypothetical protein
MMQQASTEDKLKAVDRILRDMQKAPRGSVVGAGEYWTIFRELRQNVIECLQELQERLSVQLDKEGKEASPNG